VSTDGAPCRNCGAPRTGRFCAACGQSDRNYVRAMSEIVREFARESLGLDSRLVRTLGALLFQPGMLTRDWTLDRRASWVAPVRLYLVISLAFFSVLSFTGGIAVSSTDATRGDAAVRADLGDDEGLADIVATLDETERARLRSIFDQRGLPTEALDRAARASAAPHAGAPQAVSSVPRALRERMLSALEDPAGAWQAIVADLPFAMFLALPLYAAWLKLLYPRRFYVEHVVFALHLHAFLFAIGICLLLLPDEPEPAASIALQGIQRVGAGIGNALTLAAGAYYALALRRVYGQRWPVTLVKFAVLNIAHVVLVVLGIAFTTVVALALF
jgi:hypothetical protein